MICWKKCLNLCCPFLCKLTTQSIETCGKINLVGMCSHPIDANRLRCQVGTFNTECSYKWTCKLAQALAIFVLQTVAVVAYFISTDNDNMISSKTPALIWQHFCQDYFNSINMFFFSFCVSYQRGHIQSFEFRKKSQSLTHS